MCVFVKDFVRGVEQGGVPPMKTGVNLKAKVCRKGAWEKSDQNFSRVFNYTGRGALYRGWG